MKEIESKKYNKKLREWKKMSDKEKLFWNGFNGFLKGEKKNSPSAVKMWKNV